MEAPLWARLVRSEPWNSTPSIAAMPWPPRTNFCSGRSPRPQTTESPKATNFILAIAQRPLSSRVMRSSSLRM